MILSNIFRRINKYRKYFLINAFGLSIAFACILLVYSYTHNELSYDKFHSKADRICRLTLNSNTGKSSMIDARIWSGWAPILLDEIPQIQEMVRLISFRNAIVSIDDNSFYSKKVFGVDSTFFDVFDYELILGNEKTLFKEPHQVAVSESMAQRYFGTIDVLDRQIKIVHQQIGVAEDYNIKAIYKDFPENSHIKADLLCTIDESQDVWSYTYLLLNPDVEFKQVQDAIQALWDKRYTEQDYNPIVNLQPLTDIHLHSHKSRELVQNGNVRTLYLLISGVLIILIIALINFINLNYVQYLSEQKNLIIKTINGATRITLAKEFLNETVILMTIVVFSGFIIVYYLSDIFHYEAILYTPKTSMAVVTFLFFATASIAASLPFLYRKQHQNLTLSIRPKRNIYKIFLILQVALSIVAITATLFLQKQINYINLLHPDAKKSDLVVMPNNSGNVVSSYETLKQQVLKHPEILAVSAVMEEPAGIVTDNFPYILEGENSDEQKTINILCIDSNFFSFFVISPIAGTMDIGSTPSFEWEQKAIQLWQLESNMEEIPPGLKEEVMPIRGKYIINKMALSHLGIESAEEAIGKSFKLDFMGNMFPQGEIIGVVDDFHYTNIYVKEKPLVMVARKMFCHCFLFRIDPNKKGGAIAALKNEWEKIYPDVPFHYEFVTESYRKVYQNEYTQMKVLLLFALISIMLSVIGIYAMVSFNLKMKTKEIGIRKVNGATIIEIMKMLNKDFVKWVAIAFVIAVPISYLAIQKWLENFAYKTTISWWIFALAGFIALLITLITVSWQTYWAALKNPVEALRFE